MASLGFLHQLHPPGPPYLMNWYDACANEPPGAYTGEISAATSRTGVPAGTLRLEPSGSVIVT